MALLRNGRTGRRRVVTSQWEALERLPAEVRAALWEGPQPWCCVAVLTIFRRAAKAYGAAEGARQTAQMVMRWHAIEIEQARPYQPARKPGQKALPFVASPHLAAGATMQGSAA
jgi:hypothetical protein